MQRTRLNDNILIMFKRLLMSFMTVVLVYTLLLVGFRLFEPEKISSSSFENHTNLELLNYETLKDYTMNSGPSVIHYYFFCSPENNDCVYVHDTILTSVAGKTNLDLYHLIEYVDISALEQRLETNRLKTEWTINTYPALLACRVENGKIIVSNKIEWDSNHPISDDDIIQWLTKNGLIH